MTATEVEWYLGAHPAEAAVVPATTTSRLLLGFPVVFYGFAFQNTSGSTGCSIVILDGLDALGRTVLPVMIAAGGTSLVWLAHPGVRLQSGAYLNVLSQGVSGAVFYRPWHPHAPG